MEFTAPGSGEASAAAVRMQLKKTNRAPSGSDERDVSGAEEAWTGEKKTKTIQTAPTSHVNLGQMENHEQIEGFDWDEGTLKEKIDAYLGRLNPGLPGRDNEEFWARNDEQQLTALGERIHLYHIRAFEISKGTPLEELEMLDDAKLREMYPPSDTENWEFILSFKPNLDWFFDREYCKFANLEDYQRLTLRKNFEFEEWEFYRETCSTLEGDREFVQFWEKLSSETKWIDDYMTDNYFESRRIGEVAFYHTLKISAQFPKISEALINMAFSDYSWFLRFNRTSYKRYANLYLEIWKLVAKQKMKFEDALKQVPEKGYTELPCLFIIDKEAWVTKNYITYVSHIDEKVPEGKAYMLIMEAVKQFIWRPKMYYDYAKKKLGIAKEIGLIPLNPNKSSVVT